MSTATYLASVAALATLLSTSPAQSAEICGDLNESGGVSASDSLLLLRFSVGQSVDISCPAGFTLPYAGSANSPGTSAFAVTNTGDDVAILGTSTTGNPGIFGTSPSSSGVAGFSVTGAGVSGASTNSKGVFGVEGNGSVTANLLGKAGVHGDSGANVGVGGTSYSGIGVYGLSTTGTGISGDTTSSSLQEAGVRGYSSAGAPAVSGYGSGGVGVRGESNYSYGVFGASGSGDGVIGIASGATSGSGVAGVNDAGWTGVYGRSKANINRAGYFDGGLTVINGSKSFVEPHPTDPGKQIRFVALEGPETGTYFRGTSRTVGGHATVEVPEAFRLVTEAQGLTVVATPMGELALLACMSATLDEIEFQSSQDVEFHYVVHGVRKGYADFEPIEENTSFVPTSEHDPSLTRPLPPATVERLIRNGTLESEGTLNMDTVRRLGWDQREAWRETANEQE